MSDTKVTLPSSKAPYEKDRVFYCQCRICGKENVPLQYSLETHADNILICVDCFKQKFSLVTNHTILSWHLAITNKIKS